ncbi:MAG: hypothetical protein K2F53_00110, partial [Rikenellaceae bacterium]|nr:hypothetical protein [Rikenellaceae bacterium]
MRKNIIYLCAAAILSSCTFQSASRVGYVDDIYNIDGKQNPARSAESGRERTKSYSYQYQEQADEQVYLSPRTASRTIEAPRLEKIDSENYYPGMIEQLLAERTSGNTAESDRSQGVSYGSSNGYGSNSYGNNRGSSNGYGSTGYNNYGEGFEDGFKNGYAAGYSDGWGWTPSWYGFGAYTSIYRPGWSVTIGWNRPWYAGSWYSPWYSWGWTVSPWYDPWYTPWYNPWHNPWHDPWYSPWHGPVWGGGHHHHGPVKGRPVIYGSGHRTNIIGSTSSGVAGGSYRRPSVSDRYNGGGTYNGSSTGNGSYRRPSTDKVISGGNSGIAGGRGGSIYNDNRGNYGGMSCSNQSSGIVRND